MSSPRHAGRARLSNKTKKKCSGGATFSLHWFCAGVVHHHQQENARFCVSIHLGYELMLSPVMMVNDGAKVEGYN